MNSLDITLKTRVEYKRVEFTLKDMKYIFSLLWPLLYGEYCIL